MAKIPGEKYGGWLDYIKSIYPGVGFCIALGFLAKWLDANIIPERFFFLNYVFIAIILGIFVKNVFHIPEKLNDGIDFCTKICLYIGIVLLGARLNLVEIFSIGTSAILMVAISISFSIALCGWLGKKVGIGERWGHLIGTGIGVCGISAVMALAPAIKAREREILTAIGAVILMDIMVLIALPAIGHPLGWGDTLAGFIAGVVPANTAQSIAIGYAYSDGAGTVATIVKSARNLLLPVVVLVMTYIYTVRGLPVGEKVRAGLLWNKFPKFIVGLLIAAAISTMGLISSEGIALARELSSWFFVVCFVGIGAGIKLVNLGKQDMTVVSFGLVMLVILWLYAYFYSIFALSL